MIEKVTGIEVKGRRFAMAQKFELFSKPEQRVALVYGRNGSGKTTLGRAFNQANVVDDLKIATSVLLEDGSSLFLDGDVAEIRGMISVFNEQYVDKKIHLAENQSGLGTIVLFSELEDVRQRILHAEGAQLSLSDDIDRCNEQLAPLTDEANPVSPAYLLESLCEALRGTWAEEDQNLKGNSIKTRVTPTLVQEIAELQCRTSHENLAAEISEKTSLYETLGRIKDVNEIPPVPTLDVDFFDELSYVELLNRRIDKPEFSNREKRILSLLEQKAGRIDEIRATFSNDGQDWCPYCFQEVSASHRHDLLECVRAVLNETVSEYRGALAAERLPTFDSPHEMLKIVDEPLVVEIGNFVKIANQIVGGYADDRREKDGNVYLSKIFPSRQLQPVVERLKVLTADLAMKRESLFKSSMRKAEVKNELLRLYKEKAHWQIAGQYVTYKAQKELRENLEKHIQVLNAEFEKIDKYIEELKAKQAGTHIAVECINESLRYIYASEDRFQLEAKDSVYALKSNGHDVKPADVSTGERHALALAYFFVDIMAQHRREEFYTQEKLLVVDDPVSSFDQEHKVGVFSFLMREFERTLKGNPLSRIVVLTHDIFTEMSLRNSFEMLAKNVLTNPKLEFGCFELKNSGMLDKFEFKNFAEYSSLLEDIYEFAKNGVAGGNDRYIGNEMRRVLEAYSSFLYRKDFALLFREDVIGKNLGGLQEYFASRLAKIVLHNESHMEYQVKTLAFDGNLFGLISSSEKQAVAKDVLCLLYVLDKEHVVSHLNHKGDHQDRINDIQSWCDELKRGV